MRRRRKKPYESSVDVEEANLSFREPQNILRFFGYTHSLRLDGGDLEND
jgi:hypothetical protein